MGDWLTECEVEGAYYSLLGPPYQSIWYAGGGGLDGAMARDVDGSMEQKTEPSSNHAATTAGRCLMIWVTGWWFNKPPAPSLAPSIA